jgi:hypothetical protein
MSVAVNIAWSHVVIGLRYLVVTKGKSMCSESGCAGT